MGVEGSFTRFGFSLSLFAHFCGCQKTAYQALGRFRYPRVVGAYEQAIDTSA